MIITYKVKLIFFDVGGVLLSKVTNPYQVAADILGVDAKALYKTTGHVLFKEGSNLKPPPYAVTLEEELAITRELMAEGAKEMGIKVTDDQITRAGEALVYREYQMHDNATVVIEELNKKYRVGLLTNAAPSRRLDLNNHNIAHLFDPIVISGEVEKVKPNRDIYEHALAIAKLSANEVVFIDNDIKFLDGARLVGIKETVLYDPSGTKDMGCHRRIKNLNELLEIY